MDEKDKTGKNEKTEIGKEKKPEQKKETKPIIISAEARRKQKERAERIDGVCKKFRQSKVPMNKPLLVESLLNFVYSDPKIKKEFEDYVVAQRYKVNI